MVLSMTVKVIYLNGVFNYFRGIESITQSKRGFVLHPIKGADILIDYRLKMEITY